MGPRTGHEVFPKSMLLDLPISGLPLYGGERWWPEGDWLLHFPVAGLSDSERREEEDGCIWSLGRGRWARRVFGGGLSPVRREDGSVDSSREKDGGCGGGDGLSRAKEGKEKRDIQIAASAVVQRRRGRRSGGVGEYGSCGVILGLLVFTGRWNEAGCDFVLGVHGGMGAVSRMKENGKERENL
ncbi:hypothetical protein HAX54_017962, partial [Datura stramonium]|nr:hypothetical protein [Datura stramonium]